MVQMVEKYQQYGRSVLGVERVPYDQVNKYGIVDSKPISDRLSEITTIVEKPNINEAPSNLAVVGRYILSPAIFGYLEKTGKGAGGEIQLTDAIAQLMNEEAILAYEFLGQRFDCGSKLGFLKATVEYALQHPELKHAFSDYLQETVKRD